MFIKETCSFNFIAALGKTYSNVQVQYSLDKGNWQQLPLIHSGLRYYGSIQTPFTTIEYYFEATKRRKKTTFGSQKKPFPGIPFSRHPALHIHLLDPHPEKNSFGKDIDQFARMDIPQVILQLPPSFFPALLKKT